MLTHQNVDDYVMLDNYHVITPTYITLESTQLSTRTAKSRPKTTHKPTILGTQAYCGYIVSITKYKVYFLSYFAATNRLVLHISANRFAKECSGLGDITLE